MELRNIKVEEKKVTVISEDPSDGSQFIITVSAGHIQVEHFHGEDRGVAEFPIRSLLSFIREEDEKPEETKEKSDHPCADGCDHHYANQCSKSGLAGGFTPGPCTCSCHRMAVEGKEKTE